MEDIMNILPWVFVLLITLAHAIICYFSYEKWAQGRWWYYILAIFAGSITNVLWFAATKIISDKKDIYLYSLVWDFFVVAVYFLLPVILLDIKLNRVGIFGLILMLIGFLLIKFEFDISN